MSTTYGATGLGQTAVSTRRVTSLSRHIRARFRNGANARGYEPLCALPSGRKLVTLKDAADCITKLPKNESDLPERQTAIEVLMLCSRGGDPMLARIGVMKALNRGVERVFNPERKDTHWGKRKLKRDQ